MIRQWVYSVLLLLVFGELSSQEETGQEDININVLYKPEMCSRQANAGDYVTVTYTGFLPDAAGAEEFDSTMNKGPVYFRLHDEASTAMKGWHLAVEGMCLKEKREVLIPAGELTANHALPNTKAPPPDRDVGYRFELHQLNDEPPVTNLFKQIDTNDDKEITKDEMRVFLSGKGMGDTLRQEDTLNQAVQNIFDSKDFDRSNTISSREFFGHARHEEL
ncbi:peptidyl-prolyl cis-trans isomerase FKBP14-like [Diadema antillarum]|uniref:peptidyl-prolyl cis-trans isomerase FKBP14-like n=1 Tax=Diadema antillarum TaxID=105358 RepID=UPI003A87D247